MKLGEINKLRIERDTDFGYFLEDEEENEVLLPNAYITDDMDIDDEIDVFLYKDSEDRLVATTLTPLIELNKFAYLEVLDTNYIGAFMDWGLPKDLLVPFSEQKGEMRRGLSYLVYLKIDEKSDRLVGSNIEKDYTSHEIIELEEGQEVDLLLYDLSDIGMNAIINNKYKGLIFNSDIHKTIKPGDQIKGYVKLIREDKKIDLSLEPIGYRQSIVSNTDTIIIALKENKGYLNISDKSTPEDIKATVGLSKKAFKKAIGNLYKSKIITISAKGITLIQDFKEEE